MVEISPKYEGNLAEEHELDFYDLAQAMVGFQRSLAITTHLVVNGRIITQAPSLKGARIIVTPPRAGSFEILASIGMAAGALYALGTAPKETPLGHLVFSLYDYAVKRLTGSHVDFDKSLGQQFAEVNGIATDSETKTPLIDNKRVDSLLEKIEPAVADMHRPIVKSKTASSAKLFMPSRPRIAPIALNSKTYDRLLKIDVDDVAVQVVGKVSSYNLRNV